MELISESKKQRYSRTVLDENNNVIAIIDGLQDKNYKLVVLLDDISHYKTKFFIDNSDEELIQMAKDMRKTGCLSLK